MGIKGLESFVDSIYKNKKSNVFKYKNLKDLKFVIDANQLSYLIYDWHKDGHYGGNYDLLYENYKSLFTKLKPYIEIVIFDGSKEDKTKALFRLNKKIKKIHKGKLDDLKEHPGIFTRTVLTEILNSLGIKYSMASGMADHAIACYANGFNESKSTFTVLSQDSYYNIYNLTKGYLSFKYASKTFKKVDSINPNTKVPVYFVDDMVSHLRLSYKSWLYFCILLGDYDAGFTRNSNYMRTNNIQKGTSFFKQLLDHARLKQKAFTQNNFQEIRETYSENDLQIVDQFIEMIEFKNTNFEFITGINGSLNDFDRFITILKDMKMTYFCCLTEDCGEKTVFDPVKKIGFYNTIYSLIKTRYPEVEFDVIIEHCRVQNPSVQLSRLVSQSEVRVGVTENNLVYDYLMKRSKSAVNDNLTLFLSSLSIWFKHMNENSYVSKLELKPIDFIEAVLMNFVIINLIRPDISCDDDIESMFKYRIVEANNLDQIFQLYSKIINQIRNFNGKKIPSMDLKLVHRLNEFQAIYYSMGLLNKIACLNFKFLSPSLILNGFFCTKFLLEKSIQNSNSNKIFNSVNSSGSISMIFNFINQKFEKNFINIYNVDFVNENIKFDNLTNC